MHASQATVAINHVEPAAEKCAALFAALVAVGQLTTGCKAAYAVAVIAPEMLAAAEASTLAPQGFVAEVRVGATTAHELGPS